MALLRGFPGVPSGARSRNLLFHRQALCQLSYRHRMRRGWESKPSSVPDGHLSRSSWDRSRRRLRDGSRLPASASNLLAADSEIAAGRITLFTPVNRFWSLLLSRGEPRANLDCRRPDSRRASLAFTRHLCSVQLGLSSGVFTPATILAHPDPRLSTCGTGVIGC